MFFYKDDTGIIEQARTYFILLLKASSDVKFLNSIGRISHICGRDDDKVSDLYITVFTFLHWNSDLFLVSKDLVFNLKTPVIISGARLCFTLNISIAKFCRFFLCILTELFFFQQFGKRSSKIILDKTQCSFVKCVNSIIQRPAMIHPYQWVVPKL